MLILALTRKGQESFNGQVPKDDEEPASSSSQEIQSSSSEASSSSEINPTSSSDGSTGILTNRAKQLQAKEIRGTVNAKGARVNPNNKANYQVDFNF
jgi:hypothetical protein